MRDEPPGGAGRPHGAGRQGDQPIRPLDRTNPLPLWAQLLAALRERLAAGEFAERFPTDEELTAQYGVSRQTVREAARRLEQEGVIERRRGRGTRVVAPRLDQPVGTLYSLFRTIEAQGVEQASVVRALETRRDPEAAAHLELPADAPLVYLERLRLAGGTPLAIDRAWLPHDLAHPLLEADFSHTALYDELAALCGLVPATGRERTRPVVPSGPERKLLGLGPREAAFAVERLTRTADGRALEWRRSLLRGDRCAFVVEWSGASASAEQAVRLRPA